MILRRFIVACAVRSALRSRAENRFPLKTAASTASILEIPMTHASSPAVSVIVPLYNEEENVPILQAELRAALRGVDHEFIFVDDGSADCTMKRIEAAPNLRVIRL